MNNMMTRRGVSHPFIHPEVTIERHTLHVTARGTMPCPLVQFPMHSHERPGTKEDIAEVFSIAGKTGYKLHRHTFSEITTSILYRLLHLSFQDSSLDESIRLGMVIFSSVVFLRDDICSGTVFDTLGTILLKMESIDLNVPPPMLFWMLMMWKFGNSTDKYQLSDGFIKIAKQLDVSSWSQARVALKGVMWIDVVHGQIGEVIFNHGPDIGGK